MTGPAPAPPAALDRVLLVQPGRRAVAVRNVGGTLALFDSHFPRFPVLPGVLLLESMAATAGLAAGDRQPWRLAAAQLVRFRHYVQPGDQVEITADVLAGADPVTCSVTAAVDGRTVATVRRLRLAAVPTRAVAAT
jgi:3-hydroxyacyl-[acyl-carrier-protein] dehydratase